MFRSSFICITECTIQERYQVVKQEVAVDGVQVRLKVESVALPQRYVFYLLENSSGYEVKNAEALGSTIDQRSELQSFIDILNDPRRLLSDPTSKRKRKM